MSLDLLAQYGDDALANHFRVIFPEIPGSDHMEELRLRTLSCDIPERTIGTYEVMKDGKKYEKVSGVEEQSKEFSFTYRCRKDLAIYKAFNIWMQSFSNLETGEIAIDEGLLSSWRVPLVVQASVGENVYAEWGFLGWHPKSIAGLSFDETSGDPLTVQISGPSMEILFPLV